jgi:hypothetical protein
MTETDLLSITKWGPSAWAFIHAITFSYPEHPTDHHRKMAFSFLMSLTALLPCGRCRVHFHQELSKEGITDFNHPVFQTRLSFSRFMVDVHNAVNRRLGKDEVSYKEVMRSHSESDTTCPITSSSDRTRTFTYEQISRLTIFILLFSLIGVIILVVCFNRAHMKSYR